jgi:LacI family transcriptional regulator
MALGAMSALRAAGLRPGVDVAVAGFDDVVDADDVTPGLTSVDLALEAIGARAVELALEPATGERRVVEFEPRVTLRESTPRR